MSNIKRDHFFLYKRFLFAVVLTGVSFWLYPAAAAPSPDLWPRWQAHVPDSTTIVDHTPWNRILKKYLVTNHPSGINRFRYGSVSPEDRKNLTDYLRRLQMIAVSSLNRKEQLAYWINLYNALTIKVILDHYPVKSIMAIDISPGFFNNGPWDAKLLTIEGEKVSLNDIEHRIQYLQVVPGGFWRLRRGGDQTFVAVCRRKSGGCHADVREGFA
jgi:hypothetical protein